MVFKELLHLCKSAAAVELNARRLTRLQETLLMKKAQGRCFTDASLSSPLPDLHYEHCTAESLDLMGPGVARRIGSGRHDG